MSHDKDFWERCVEVGCVIAPVPVYSGYGPDGNTHPEDFIGIRFVALDFGTDAVGPDYYFGIEEHHSGADVFYETPDEALQAWITHCTEGR